MQVVLNCLQAEDDLQPLTLPCQEVEGKQMVNEQEPHRALIGTAVACIHRISHLQTVNGYQQPHLQWTRKQLKRLSVAAYQLLGEGANEQVFKPRKVWWGSSSD